MGAHAHNKVSLYIFKQNVSLTQDFSIATQEFLPHTVLMKLDPRLETSSSMVCTLGLCQVRLSHNAAFPWILLIPEVNNCSELTDLSVTEQQLLISEIDLACRVMQVNYSPDKLNIATLGNVVPQMHIHVIARYQSDPAWPNPVWNTVSRNYDVSIMEQTLKNLRQTFSDLTRP